MKRTVMILIPLALTALTAAAQETPELVNYQGLLTDAGGVALATGTYDLSFSLYADAAGTSRVWGPEVHAGAPVIEGQFNVILGSAVALGDAFKGAERYLGVAVSPEAEITPRQRILSTPYALNAQNGTPAGAILPFAGPILPPGGWLLCDGADVSRAAYPALFAAIGTTWGAGDGSTTFNLPDLMAGGRFLRGGTPGQASYQDDATALPNNAFTTGAGQGNHIHYWKGFRACSSGSRVVRSKDQIETDPLDDINRNDGQHAHTVTGGGDAETRPINAAVNWIIKI